MGLTSQTRTRLLVSVILGTAAAGFVAGGGAEPFGEFVEQVVQFFAQVVARDGVADRETDRGKLPGQELGVGLGLRGTTTILVLLTLVVAVAAGAFL